MEQYHVNDVLLGRGRKVYKHPGNFNHRQLVQIHKKIYNKTSKKEKINVSRSIVDAIHAQNPPGRFLEYHASSHSWREITYEKSVEKTSQALREKKRERSGEINNIKNITRRKISNEPSSNQESFNETINQSQHKSLIGSGSHNEQRCRENTLQLTEHVRACLYFEKTLQESFKDIGVEEEEIDSLIYHTFGYEKDESDYYGSIFDDDVEQEIMAISECQ